MITRLFEGPKKTFDSVILVSEKLPKMVLMHWRWIFLWNRSLLGLLYLFLQGFSILWPPKPPERGSLSLLSEIFADTLYYNNNFYTTMITTSYKYDGGEETEFLFSCKGRPFTAMVSRHLQTPTTLVDYNLVRDIGIKMTDLQCKRFSLGGYRMRSTSRTISCWPCIYVTE